MRLCFITTSVLSWPVQAGPEKDTNVAATTAKLTVLMSNETQRRKSRTKQKQPDRQSSRAMHKHSLTNQHVMISIKLTITPQPFISDTFMSSSHNNVDINWILTGIQSMYVSFWVYAGVEGLKLSSVHLEVTLFVPAGVFKWRHKVELWGRQNGTEDAHLCPAEAKPGVFFCLSVSGFWHLNNTINVSGFFFSVTIIFCTFDRWSEM